MAGSRDRGHRAGLTRQTILQAAVRLADKEGLAAMSMRRLGAELGVEAMTLYHYLPNKNALLDGMVEHVVSEATPFGFEDLPWRDGLRSYARSLLAVLTEHRNVIPLIMSRPATTPQNLEAMESALGLLQSAGFDLQHGLDVVYSLTGFVLGQAVLYAEFLGSGPQPAGAQERDVPQIDPKAYPLFTQAVRTLGQHGAMSRFEFALEALLAGFEAARAEPPTGEADLSADSR